MIDADLGLSGTTALHRQGFKIWSRAHHAGRIRPSPAFCPAASTPLADAAVAIVPAAAVQSRVSNNFEIDRLSGDAASAHSRPVVKLYQENPEWIRKQKDHFGNSLFFPYFLI